MEERATAAAGTRPDVPQLPQCERGLREKSAGGCSFYDHSCPPVGKPAYNWFDFKLLPPQGCGRQPRNARIKRSPTTTNALEGEKTHGCNSIHNQWQAMPGRRFESRGQEGHDHRGPFREWTTSLAESLGHRAGAAMRLLPVRADHAGGYSPRQKQEAYAGTD